MKKYYFVNKRKNHSNVIILSKNSRDKSKKKEGKVWLESTSIHEENYI